MARIHTQRDIRGSLRREGFASLSGSDLSIDPSLTGAWRDLQADFADLPVDPYGGYGARQRRFGWFVYFPASGQLVALPGSSYRQPPQYGTDDGGIARTLPPLADGTRINPFLEELIRFDVRHLPWPEGHEEFAYQVGVHLVRLEATASRDAAANPDRLHKDGEPFTWVHLVRRDGVRGGETVVADNQRQVIYDAPLTRPLDSVVVADGDVYHQVRRVSVAPGFEVGVRDALLIDATPLVRQLVPPAPSEEAGAE